MAGEFSSISSRAREKKNSKFTSQIFPEAPREKPIKKRRKLKSRKLGLVEKNVFLGARFPEINIAWEKSVSMEVKEALLLQRKEDREATLEEDFPIF